MKFFLTSLILHISLLGVISARARMPETQSVWIVADIHQNTGAASASAQPKRTSKSKTLTSRSSVTASEPKQEVVSSSAAESHETVQLGAEADTGTNGPLSPYSYLISEIMQKRIYPYESLRLKQQGQVRVSFQINDKGQIVDIRIQEPCPYQLLNHAALQTLKKVQLNIEQPRTTELINKSYSFIFDYTIKTLNKS